MGILKFKLPKIMRSQKKLKRKRIISRDSDKRIHQIDENSQQIEKSFLTNRKTAKINKLIIFKM